MLPPKPVASDRKISAEIARAAEVYANGNNRDLSTDYADDADTKDREQRENAREDISALTVLASVPKETAVAAVEAANQKLAAKYEHHIPRSFSYDNALKILASAPAKEAAAADAKAARIAEKQVRAEKEVPNPSYFDSWARNTKETQTEILERHGRETKRAMDSYQYRMEAALEGRSDELPGQIKSQAEHEARVSMIWHKRELEAFSRIQKQTGKTDPSQTSDREAANTPSTAAPQAHAPLPGKTIALKVNRAELDEAIAVLKKSPLAPRQPAAMVSTLTLFAQTISQPLYAAAKMPDGSQVQKATGKRASGLEALESVRTSFGGTNQFHRNIHFDIGAVSRLVDLLPTDRKARADKTFSMAKFLSDRRTFGREATYARANQAPSR